MERTIQKAKKEIKDLKAKLDSAKTPSGLRWEARRLLVLFAQGLHDWTAPEYRKPWRHYYDEALKYNASELKHPETMTKKTLYWLGFMTWYRGKPDEAKQWKSELEFYLLARMIAPKATEELILHAGLEHLYTPDQMKAAREFLQEIDDVLAEREKALSEEDQAEKSP